MAETQGTYTRRDPKITGITRIFKKLFIRFYTITTGRTCGTYGGEERCIQGFSGET
jgi:hypothetical protein